MLNIQLLMKVENSTIIFLLKHRFFSVERVSLSMFNSKLKIE